MDAKRGPPCSSEQAVVTGSVPTTFLKTVPVTTHPYEREWDGDICDFGGRAGLCDSQAWTTVCLTLWCPCVVLGLNMRRAFKESAWVHAVAFFIIIIGAPIALITTFYMYLFRSAVPRIEKADTLGELNAAVNYILRLEYIFYFSALACGIIGVLYGFAMRLRIIKKYNIREGCCTAFCWWWWCTSCALCQERRTMLTNVDSNSGVWSDSPPTVPPIQGTQQAVTQPPVPANMDNHCAV